VIIVVPIANEKSKIIGGLGEGNRDERPTKNTNPSKPTGCLVEGSGGEVEEASNLILHLHFVRKIHAHWNGACCPIYSILI